MQNIRIVPSKECREMDPTQSTEPNVEVVGGVSVLTIMDPQFLGSEQTGSVRTVLTAVFEEGANKVLVDFCNMEFPSSPALGMLMNISKKWVRGQPRKMRFCGMKRDVFEVFTMTNLVQFFDVFDGNREDALVDF